MEGPGSEKDFGVTRETHESLGIMSAVGLSRSGEPHRVNERTRQWEECGKKRACDKT